MFVLQSNDDVLKKRAPGNLALAQRGGMRQVAAGCIPAAGLSNVTWLESMTHLPSGAFALCDKSWKNVNKLSENSANLLCYLRTAPKKDLPRWRVFVSWQGSAQAERSREIQIRWQIKWQENVPIQPWNNFYISPRFSGWHRRNKQRNGAESSSWSH